MIDITKCKEIAIENDERNKLIEEFEQLFIAGKGALTHENYYSLDYIKKKFPKVAELYNLIRNT